MDKRLLIDDLFAVVERAENSVRQAPTEEADAVKSAEMQTGRTRPYHKSGNSEPE
jgi:hypothetical protein